MEEKTKSGRQGEPIPSGGRSPGPSGICPQTLGVSLIIRNAPRAGRALLLYRVRTSLGSAVRVNEVTS